MYVYTVSDTSSLNAALASAEGPVTLQLNAGDYSQIKIENNKHPIALFSSDPVNTNITEILLSGASDISISYLTIKGAIRAENSKNIEVVNSKLQTLRLEKVQGAQISENHFADGKFHLNIQYSENINVTKNVMERFTDDGIRVSGNSKYIAVNGNLILDANVQSRGTHPDFIQMLGSVEAGAPRHIQIANNILYDNPDTGLENAQGIFIADHRSDGYRDISVTGNYLNVSGTNTIGISGAVENFEVSGNTLLSGPHGGGGYIRASATKDLSNHGLIIKNNITRAIVDSTDAAIITDNVQYRRAVSHTDYWIPGDMRSSFSYLVNEALAPAGSQRHDFMAAVMRGETILPPQYGPKWMQEEYRLHVGTQGDSRIVGGEKVDVIYGRRGNDFIDGRGGSDIMIGGMHNDTYIVDSVGDIVIEFAGEGYDFIRATVSYFMPSHVEGLELVGASAVDARGNEGNNRIIGNGQNNVLDGLSGDDYLFGGAGNDNLRGGSGADTLVGGLGDDTYWVDSAADIVVEDVGQGTDLVRSSISYHLGSALENLELIGDNNIDGRGNAQNNIMVGNDRMNVLEGLSGDDTLHGLGGRDTLLGGAGNDTLDGGWGRDVIIGGSGSDVLIGGSGGDTFEFWNGSDVGDIDTIVDFELGVDRILIKFDANEIAEGVQRWRIGDSGLGTVQVHDGNGKTIIVGHNDFDWEPDIKIVIHDGGSLARSDAESSFLF